MWIDFVVRKIFGFRGQNLKDYFDDLSLEFVIPKLLQYVAETSACKNAIWFTKDEFERFINGHEQKGFEADQDVHYEIKKQSLHPIENSEILAFLKNLAVGSLLAQTTVSAGGSVVLLPIKHFKTHEVLAYLLLTGVEGSKVQKVISRISKDISYMEKHIGFSLQYWEAQRLSFLDDLTGLYNQKFLNQVLDSEIYRAQRSQDKFAVLFIDIDHFKTINDHDGHVVGSRILIEIGHILKALIRRSDYAFRYGGDEFVLVLPQTDAVNAVVTAERIRTTIEKTHFLIDGEQIKITLSIGLACYPDHAKNYKDIIKMADEAMYSGKNKSRNIVFVAS